MSLQAIYITLAQRGGNSCHEKITLNFKKRN